mmetsp:Transcript_7758/g.19976  ORF Transcript_7758/g.19976 Transcript_7758/m.19976 type:complete len:81 (+) Transcript_7758:478-720(+)
MLSYAEQNISLLSTFLGGPRAILLVIHLPARGQVNRFFGNAGTSTSSTMFGATAPSAGSAVLVIHCPPGKRISTSYRCDP